MPVKPVLESLESVPEPIRDLYAERDGKFVLDLDGAPPGFVPASEFAEVKGKMVEFRDNNIAVLKEREALQQKVDQYKDIDPDKYRAAVAKLDELEQKGVKKADDIDARVLAAVREAVSPLQTQLEQFKSAEAEARSKLARKELEGQLTAAGMKAGIQESAMEDYLQRGLRVFKLGEDGKVIAKDGDTPLFSAANPSEPLSIGEWAGRLSTQAPHLFKPSNGGGAHGGSGGPAPKRTFDPDDPKSFLDNLEGIAKGEVVRSH